MVPLVAGVPLLVQGPGTPTLSVPGSATSALPSYGATVAAAPETGMLPGDLATPQWPGASVVGSRTEKS